MPVVDDITALPLTPALLSFYREKLRDNIRQSACVFADRIEQLWPELDHMHQLEVSLSSSVTTIKSFELENNDLRTLLGQIIEENARLRLNQKADCPDRDLSLRLLESLSLRSPIADHSNVIASLVERCEMLESFATRTVSDLNKERTRSEELSVHNKELQESLQYSTDKLIKELNTLQGQPSSQDWEFLKSEVNSLNDQQSRDQEEMSRLKAENEKLRSRVSSLVSMPDTRGGDATCGQHVENGHEMQQDLTRLKHKLHSLEKFATQFLPDDHVRGVPEFFHTVDKTKGRVEEIEERLARRMRERRAIRA